MSDKDKIIEICREVHNVCHYRPCEYCNYRKFKPDCINLALADCLIENGFILPPCKVGDTVYEIQPFRNRVQPYEIISIKYNGHYWFIMWKLKDDKGIYGNLYGFVEHRLGKDVFLTKEEAEKALRGEGE